MSTRVTNQMISRSVLNDLNEVSQRLSRTQQRMSSGKQITRASDDPYGTSRALTLRSDVAATQQYQRNVGEAVGWQNITDAALSKITDAVHRARELGRHLVEVGEHRPRDHRVGDSGAHQRPTTPVRLISVSSIWSIVDIARAEAW